ncbi:MAG TPA: M28 family peptidase [Acidobacteriaceae bacterium]|nr:M28 family peptidase [Acidobacteriaceae bacterium]
MKRFFNPTLCLTFLLTASLLQALDHGSEMPEVPALQGIPEAARQAAESIDPEKIRAHVRFLSSDLLEGRGPGKRGGQLAAEYIATQFALAGARPAGDNGTYFQSVPLMAVHTDVEQTSFTFLPSSGAPIKLKYGEDYVTKDQTGAPSVDLDAPIVFVGYGIDAPEYHWNDYQGIDVKGKMVLAIVNEPPSNDEHFFQGKALTYYGRWTYKFEEAARRGAAGIMVIHRTDLASYGWDVVKNSESTETSYLRDDPLAVLKAAGWIQLDVAQKLFAAAGMNADQMIEAAGKRGFKSIQLPVRLKAHIVSQVRDYNSDNVIAMVPGADSRPGRNVLYTAHYDHLGIDPSQPGDKIYNGAVDNGTGCGILLEMVRAFAAAKIPPPRNVYFASVTAEEQGLLGSKYLGLHPPEPIRDFALDLNFDELLPIGIPTSVQVLGAERTSFYPVVEKTAAAFNLQIQPDNSPMAGIYYRSDHFSLARVGVPAFSIDEGDLFAGHPEGWGRAQKDDYDANRYHRPADEYSANMDFRADARLAQFGFLLGWQALSSPPITWKPGDEFEAARIKSMGP